MSNQRTTSDRSWIVVSLLLIAVSVPLVLELIPPNDIYGFRIGATRSDPQLWYKANRAAGLAFLGAFGLAALVFAAMPRSRPKWVDPAVFSVTLLVAILLSFAYVARVT